MAQVGQTTATGGRSQFVYETSGVIRRVTLTEAATLNYVGCFCWEQLAANTNSLKAAIYTTAGVKLYETNVLAGAITSTSSASPYNAHIPFAAGVTLAAGTYDIVIAGTTIGGGVAVVSGQNGPGGVPVLMSGATIYPTFPSDYTGLVDSAATRQWDIYLDYTASSSSTGTLAATESGADTFAGAGGVGSNGIRLTLRDTDTGALAASLTGLIVSVRAGSNSGSTLYSSTSGTTNSSGVYELASTSIGSIGDYVYVTVEKSDHSIVAAYRVQVIDLNA